MTWKDGFKVTCDECGKTRENFYDPSIRGERTAQRAFSEMLEREGWTNPNHQDHHICPDCSRKTELEKKMEGAVPEKSWIDRVIEKLIP